MSNCLKMKLSRKNSNFVEKYTILFSRLKFTGGTEIHGNNFAIIVQPSDGRRQVYVMSDKTARKLSEDIKKILKEN